MASEFLRKIAEVLYPCPVKPSQESPKESYYNNKYPKQDITYKGRFVPNSTETVAIDVRNFLNEHDSAVKKISDGLLISRLSDDEKALSCLLWIIDNIKYVSDSQKGKKDYWQFVFETLYYKTGDCEDGAILLANLMMASGIPYWKIRLSVGDVKAGAHGYVVYYCELKDRWVILDWCYEVNKSKISERKDYKEEADYLTVWFSWNSKYSFSKGLNDKAEKILNEDKSVDLKKK